MSDTRTRVRKPDAETAEEEAIVTEEVVAAAEPEAAAAEPEVTATRLLGPFTRDGFHIVDNGGRRILMAGVEGDIVRTGPGIAEAVVDFLNRSYADAQSV